jgi:hypothetical protein
MVAWFIHPVKERVTLCRRFASRGQESRNDLAERPEPGAAFAGETEKQSYTKRAAVVVSFLRQEGSLP